MNTVMNPALLPRGVLVALAALVLVALAAVSAVRLSGVDIHAPDAVAVTTRALRFEDRPDGSIAVIDAQSLASVATITGQSGFVRGTLRGLARERKRSGLGPELPFELIGRADGRLTLHDPATGRSVDLESFGPVNAGEFARLLEPMRP
jgi:putative photosynthetic complex assembly protein